MINKRSLFCWPIPRFHLQFRYHGNYTALKVGQSLLPLDGSSTEGLTVFLRATTVSQMFRAWIIPLFSSMCLSHTTVLDGCHLTAF